MHFSLNRETINQNSFQQILILIALVFPVANYTRSSLHSESYCSFQYLVPANLRTLHTSFC